MFKGFEIHLISINKYLQTNMHNQAHNQTWELYVMNLKKIVLQILHVHRMVLNELDNKIPKNILELSAKVEDNLKEYFKNIPKDGADKEEASLEGEYDEVKHFLDNRADVSQATVINTHERGELFKFLTQNQEKQKNNKLMLESRPKFTTFEHSQTKMNKLSAIVSGLSESLKKESLFPDISNRASSIVKFQSKQHFSKKKVETVVKQAQTEMSTEGINEILRIFNNCKGQIEQRCDYATDVQDFVQYLDKEADQKEIQINNITSEGKEQNIRSVRRSKRISKFGSIQDTKEDKASIINEQQKSDRSNQIVRAVVEQLSNPTSKRQSFIKKQSRSNQPKSRSNSFANSRNNNSKRNSLDTNSNRKIKVQDSMKRSNFGQAKKKNSTYLQPKIFERKFGMNQIISKTIDLEIINCTKSSQDYSNNLNSVWEGSQCQLNKENVKETRKKLASIKESNNIIQQVYCNALNNGRSRMPNKEKEGSLPKLEDKSKARLQNQNAKKKIYLTSPYAKQITNGFEQKLTKYGNFNNSKPAQLYSPNSGLQAEKETSKYLNKKKFAVGGITTEFFNSNRQTTSLYEKEMSEVQRQAFLRQQNEKVMAQIQNYSSSNRGKDTEIVKLIKNIKYFESLHVRFCGDKCVHLNKFYEFLKKKNMSIYINRKELLLHKKNIEILATH